MPNPALLTHPVPVSQASGADILKALRETPLLHDLADAVMMRLAAISKIVDAPAETPDLQAGRCRG